MKERECSRCSKKLPPGNLTYMVNVRLFADFDGVLIEPEEEIDRQLRQILDDIEEADPGKLERDVYEEFTLFLCKGCRDRFVEESRHPWKGSFRSKKGPDPFLH